MKRNSKAHQEHEIQAFASFVHGALASLHALGAVYNLKRKNWSAATIHITVGLWDMVSTYQHYKKTK